jgi:hypothetical protein
MISALARFHPDLFALLESASQNVFTSLPLMLNLNGRGADASFQILILLEVAGIVQWVHRDTGWTLESIGYSHEELLELVIVHDCALSKVSLGSCLNNLGWISESAGF